MTTSAARAEFTSIDHFDGPTLDITPAAQLRAIREQAPEFKQWFRATGQATAFAARSLITAPYPTKYALYEACSSKAPYVWFVNRLFVVQWKEADGTLRTMLAEPSDYELAIETPFFRRVYDDTARKSKALADRLSINHPTVSQHLETLGLRPEDIDYLSFDHLHTQDIRRIVGTTVPAPDLGYADAPISAAFPNAKLIVHRDELRHAKDVHPFQARFHQSSTYADIDESRLLIIDGDVLLGPGVALLWTPGHTLGNHSLVVNTEHGILASSENGVAVESYAPLQSKLPGVAKWANKWGYEVVMNFNTPEYASWQYNSMVKEKLIVDPIPGHPQLPQVFPSSELTRHRFAPFIKPLFEHGEVTFGTVQTPER